MSVMNLITKFIAIIVVIVLVMVGGIYIMGQEKDSSVMDVSVDVLLDEDGYWNMTYVNGTFREVNALDTPKGGDMFTPGLVTNVIHEGRFIGQWTSVMLDANAPLNSTKTYNMTIGLFKKPVNGDSVNLTVRIVGFHGEDRQSFRVPFIVEYES